MKNYTFGFLSGSRTEKRKEKVSLFRDARRNIKSILNKFASGGECESCIEFVVQLISTFVIVQPTNSQTDQTANCSCYLIKPSIIAPLPCNIIPQLSTLSNYKFYQAVPQIWETQGSILS